MPATPLGAAAGIVYGALQALTTGGVAKDSNGTPIANSAIQCLTNAPAGYTMGRKVSDFALVASQNVLSGNTLVPVGVGIAVSAVGPKVPVVGKSVNRVLRKISKGKVSL